jgi:chemotaxis protein CheC
MLESIKPLTEFENDALKELINIGVGRGAAGLNQVLNQPIKLDVPSIQLCDGKEYLNTFKNRDEPYSIVSMKFSGVHSGESMLLFHKQKSFELIEATLGMSLEEDDPLYEATQVEIGNILINAVLGSMGNILEQEFTYLPPVYQVGLLDEKLNSLNEKVILSISTRFSIESYSLEGRVSVLYAKESVEALRENLNNLV